MAIRRIRWISRIVAIIAITVIAALALPWVLSLSISWLWRWLPEQWDAWIVVAIAADATLVLLAGIWWLWWRLPKRQVRGLDIQIHDPKARADIEDNFRKTLSQALGGAAVLIGAGLALFQYLQQQQASHDLLMTKGLEQLASESLILRLGGIYALEGVMNTSEQYRRPVLDVLSAFSRVNTTGANPDTLATDIQAALTVIGRNYGGRTIDLTYLQAPGADLTRANLRYADLTGANLTHANLTGTDLSRAHLKRAILRNAALPAAILIGTDLSNADLSGVTHLNQIRPAALTSRCLMGRFAT